MTVSYRSLLASLSDSSRHSTSPSRTGPFTFLMIVLPSSRNSTRTYTSTHISHHKSMATPTLPLHGSHTCSLLKELGTRKTPVTLTCVH